MTLTPRAEQLRPLVRSLVEEATRVLSALGPFDAQTLKRTFTIFATDQALLVLGPAVDRLVRAEAPDVSLRFLPSVIDVAETLPLRMVEPPLPLPSYPVNLLWHPRLDNEAANQWLREVFARPPAR